ncbi:MAG: hypothetical protein ACC645_13045 [Pirellulales bacterium]
MANRIDLGEVRSGLRLTHIVSVVAGASLVGMALLLRKAFQGHAGARIACLRIGLVGASLAISLVAAETLLRVYQFRVYPHGYWRIDAKTGLTCGVAGYHGVRKSEYGRVAISTNEYGFRGPIFNARNSGRKVLILGDSFVQACQVEYKATLGALLEARSAGRLQVMQVGIPGWGQGDQIRWLKEVGVKLNPDIVVVVVFLGNDLTIDNMKPGNLGSYGRRVTRDGLLLKGKSKAAEVPWLSLSNLALYKLVRLNLTTSRRTQATGKLSAKDSSSDPFPIPNYYRRFLPIYRLDERNDSVFQTFFSLVEMFEALSDRAGFKLVFTLIPWHAAMSDERFHRVLDHYSLPENAYDRTVAHRILNAFFARKGILHVDLKGAFESYGKPLEAYGKTDPHLSPTGHEWVAEALWKPIDGE